VEKARAQFGDKILIEGGITMINELIAHNLIDKIELSVTPASGGDDRIDWKGLLANFAQCQSREIEGTFFYSAHN
jgi:riboflavin biosynthesis pyrimidine reductase